MDIPFIGLFDPLDLDGLILGIAALAMTGLGFLLTGLVTLVLLVRAPFRQAVFNSVMIALIYATLAPTFLILAARISLAEGTYWPSAGAFLATVMAGQLLRWLDLGETKPASTARIHETFADEPYSRPDLLDVEVMGEPWSAASPEDERVSTPEAVDRPAPIPNVLSR